MSFFKHVGKVNGKKVIVVQRSIPNEDHMAVVIYSDIMPSKYHDDVMQLLESDTGQQAWEFRDALERRMMSDGQNMLAALSNEGYLKRVAANNVQITPNAKSSMRLDELTALLSTVGRGDDAVKRLERLESSQGYDDPAKKAVEEDVVRLDEMNAENTSAAKSPVSKAPIASSSDNNDLMMQMMKTMQAMQKQISELQKDKSPKEPKIAKSKTKTSA